MTASPTTPSTRTITTSSACATCGPAATRGSDGRVVKGPSLSALVAKVAPEAAREMDGKLAATVAAMTRLKQRGETVEAYDQMIADGNAGGQCGGPGGDRRADRRRPGRSSGWSRRLSWSRSSSKDRRASTIRTRCSRPTRCSSHEARRRPGRCRRGCWLRRRAAVPARARPIGARSGRAAGARS